MEYELLEVLELLRPWDPVADRKIRVGRSGDGGYVMLDRLRPGQVAFSYGIGHDASFDAALAERGLRVHMFDHTVAAPANLHHLCSFHPEGVGLKQDPQVPCDTLAAHVARHAAGRGDLVLKMDVEGVEWHALVDTPDDVLRQFEQIVMEMHSFESLVHPGGRLLRGTVLAKLQKHFRLIHVHSNNSQELFTVDGLPVANLLEVSFARLDMCDFVASSTVFPTDLDAPCMPTKAEHRLWFYPFLPQFRPIVQEQ